MPKIEVYIHGSGADHKITSPRLSDAEVTEHMATIAQLLATPNLIELPWLVCGGTSIIAASRTQPEDRGAGA